MAIEITHRHIFHTVANLNPLILTHSVAAFAFFSMRQIPENSGADHTDQHNTEGLKRSLCGDIIMD